MFEIGTALMCNIYRTQVHVHIFVFMCVCGIFWIVGKSTTGKSTPIIWMRLFPSTFAGFGRLYLKWAVPCQRKLPAPKSRFRLLVFDNSSGSLACILYWKTHLRLSYLCVCTYRTPIVAFFVTFRNTCACVYVRTLYKIINKLTIAESDRLTLLLCFSKRSGRTLVIRCDF